MNRRRGTHSLPEEMQTTERLSTKKELAQRGSHPICPFVPVKLRRSINYRNGSIKPKLVSFNNSVTLSPIYNPKMGIPYLDQVFAKHGFMGEGSFGRVYRVRSREDRKLYAIKRLKSTVSYKDRYAEVKNNEKIGINENCVQFYMAWEEKCETFMLLEYCDMSLADFSRKNNDIPEELLWNVLYDMCKALNFLHSRNLLHLDVKPGNIMMKNGYYKLGDFGLLVDVTSGQYVSKSTLSEGDSKYLALEVLEGIYTPACDIFGLGISLLELAADLELPEHGPLWQQLRHNILPRNFYDRLFSEVCLGFKIIIEKMIIPEYKNRPGAQKILMYSHLKAIQKRDGKKARTDYTAGMVDRDYDNFETSAIAPVSCNSYVMETPCAQRYNHQNEFVERVEDENMNNNNLNGGRKSLFHVVKHSSPFEPHQLSPLSDSSFADSLNESALAESLDIDAENNDTTSCLNDSQPDNRNPLVGDAIITSTPILRVRQTRRIPREKLTFD